MKKSRKSRKAAKAVVPAASVPVDAMGGEFEALESRLLLSGIGTGTNLKRATFVDADGDQVTVSVTGKGATFNISLDGGATNNADVDTITINGAGASLSVTVNPVRQNAAVQGVSAGVFSGGVAYINTITDANLANVGNISLSGVSVTNIDFSGTDVANLSLNTGKALFADRVNNLGNGGTTNGNATELQNIGFQTIAADDVTGKITLRGVVQSNANGGLYQAYGTALQNVQGGVARGLNNFDGSVNLTGSLGGIVAQNSALNGVLNVAGKVGALTLGGAGGGALINVGGDFTLNAPQNWNIPLNVAGHLNMFVGGQLQAALTAGNGISGLAAATDDGITIGSSNGAGTLLAKAGNIAALTSAGAIGGNITASAGNIGNLAFGGNLNGNVLATVGSVGNLTSSFGVINGNVTAGTTIGNVSVNGTTGNLLAGTNIGTVASSGNVNGNLTATAGTIGAITLTNAANLNGTVNAGTTIASITAAGAINNNVTAGTGFIGDISANGINGAITATTGNINKVTSTDGINGNITSVAGNIGDITVSSKLGNDLNGAITAKGTIGAISLSGAGVDLIGAVTAQSATSKIGDITIADGRLLGAITSGDGTAASTATIGNINITTATEVGTSLLGNLRADEGIGTITVTNTKAGGFGIVGSQINANFDADATGALGAVTVNANNHNNWVVGGGALLSGASVGAVTVNNTDATAGGNDQAINGLTVTAVTSAGIITGTTNANGGAAKVIDALTVNAATLGGLTATGNTATGADVGVTLNGVVSLGAVSIGTANDGLSDLNIAGNTTSITAITGNFIVGGTLFAANKIGAAAGATAGAVNFNVGINTTATANAEFQIMSGYTGNVTLQNQNDPNNGMARAAASNFEPVAGKAKFNYI